MLKSRPKPEPAALADGQDDHSLLEAISVLRDEAAFDELFRRFEQAAYNLALYITRRQDLAAEAVQEGLLRVWLHARTFRPELSARAWILRIVAREAIKAAKRELKREEGCALWEDLDGVAQSACGVDEGELQNESLLALRRELDGLCATDRQYVALYYGVGLLQHEIGRICGVPQSTVSRQLRRALEILRSKLESGGVLGPVLVGTETLGQALCRGVEVPVGLRGGLLKRLARPGPGSPSAQLLRQAGKGRFWAVVSAVGVMLAAGVGVAWGVAVRSRQEALPSGSERSLAPPGGATGERSGQAAADAGTRLERYWDFRAGPLAEFSPFQGDWRWVAGGQKAGMATQSALPVGFLLPLQAPPGPVRVRLAGTLRDPSRPVNMGCVWSQDQQSCPYTVWKLETARSSVPRLFEVDYLLSGRFILGAYHSIQISLAAHERPYPGRRVALLLENLILHSLEIRTTTPEEFPQGFGDPEELLRKIGRPGVRHPSHPVR